MDYDEYDRYLHRHRYNRFCSPGEAIRQCLEEREFLHYCCYTSDFSYNKSDSAEPKHEENEEKLGMTFWVLALLLLLSGFGFIFFVLFKLL